MMLSEEQARTKRCQESFGDGYVSPAGDLRMAMSGVAYALHASPSYCIGSGCMAWRWHDGAPEPGEQETSCRGYCGKAGRPSP